MKLKPKAAKLYVWQDKELQRDRIVCVAAIGFSFVLDFSPAP
jgi:hypothetical protein